MWGLAGVPVLRHPTKVLLPHHHNLTSDNKHWETSALVVWRGRVWKGKMNVADEDEE